MWISKLGYRKWLLLAEEYLLYIINFSHLESSQMQLVNWNFKKEKWNIVYGTSSIGSAWLQSSKKMNNA
jgi:hypothetical protein